MVHKGHKNKQVASDGIIKQILTFFFFATANACTFYI